MTDIDDMQADSWATRTVAAIELSRRVSTWLLIGAAVALGAGVVGLVATVWTSVEPGGFYGDQWPLVLAQASSTLASALLPAGVLAAAGVALRLQAARLETAPALD